MTLCFRVSFLLSFYSVECAISILCSVFLRLIEVDPDAFWLTLNELYCPCSYNPPHPDLKPVELSGMGLPRNEYTDNVLKLLEDFGLPEDTQPAGIHIQ